MEKKVFSLKEIGDYVNSKYVPIKFMLDIKDPENFAKNYKIQAYPTFVFLGADGKEINRISGGSSPGDFIKRLENALKPENSLAYHEKKYKEDPAYAITYLNVLNNKSCDIKSANVLKEIFDKGSIESNFSKDMLLYYYENIRDLDHYIIEYILNNDKKIDKIIGKGECKRFLNRFFERKYRTCMFDLSLAEYYDILLSEVKKYKLLKSASSEFLKKNYDAMVAKDLPTLIAAAKKISKKQTSKERINICLIIESLPKLKNNTPTKLEIKQIKEYINYLISIEKNKDMKIFLSKRLTNLLDIWM